MADPFTWQPSSRAAPSPPSMPTGGLDPFNWKPGAKRLNRVVTGIEKAAKFPMEAVGAVLGAPQRFVGGLIGAHQAGQYGALPVLGSALYEVGHPSQQGQFDIQTERGLGLGELRSDDPRFRGKLRNFALDFGVENITDPLNLLFASGALRRGAMRLGGAAISGGSDLLENLLNRATGTEGRFGNAGTQLREFVQTGYNRLKKFTPLGRATVNTKENQAIGMVRDQVDIDRDILKRNEKALQGGEMPQEVSRRLLQWAYILGTRAVREQALAMGVEVTPAMAKMPVLNILPRMKRIYVPHTKLSDSLGAATGLLPGQARRVRTGAAGFIKAQGKLRAETSLYDRVAARMASYHQQLGPRGFLAKAMILNEIAPIGATRDYIARYVKDPEDVQALSEWLKSPGGPGKQGYLTEQMLRPQAFSQAMENLRPKWSQMGVLTGGKVGKLTPFTVSSKPQDTKLLEKLLTARGSVKTLTDKDLQRLKPVMDRMMAAGYQAQGMVRDLWERIAAMDRRTKFTAKMMQTGRQAVAKAERQVLPTGDDALESLLRRLDRAGTKFAERNRAINAEIARRQRFNRGLAEINAEADRILNAELNRLVPKAVLEEVFKPQTVTGGLSAAQALSEAGRQSLFFNPFVHGFKNAMTLQFLGPAGMKGVIRGLLYGLNGDAPAVLEERLKDIGASSDFVRAGEEYTGLIGAYARGSMWAKRITQRMEHGQRIALLEFLDSDPEYRALSDAEKGQLINDTLVDYQHASQLSHTLRAFGAPFPHWRLTMIARMVHAFFEQPHRVNMIARFANVFNEDMMKGLPYGVEWATPATDIKAVLPGHARQYAASTLGPAGEFLSYGMSPGNLAGEALGRYLPGGNLLLDALSLSPYLNKSTRQQPAWQRAMLDLIGAYTQAKKPNG
jgi:hypothetical protein